MPRRSCANISIPLDDTILTSAACDRISTTVQRPILNGGFRLDVLSTPSTKSRQFVHSKRQLPNSLSTNLGPLLVTVARRRCANWQVCRQSVGRHELLGEHTTSSWAAALAQVRHGTVGKSPNPFGISSGDRRV